MKASAKLLIAVVTTMLCTVIPAQTPRSGPDVIKLDPDNGSPLNGGVFEGWGTSLCWWANRIGYSDKLTDAAVDAFFDQTKGLKLNIVRYNIGGGDDPTHKHITRSDSNMPGFAQPVLGEDGKIKVDENGLAVFRYDWDRDRNQMNVLTKILKRSPDTLVEAFSNAPPYFMTWSGCSSGGVGEHKANNLRPEYVGKFADFLADVAKHFRDDLGIRLNSIEPFNESSSHFWIAYSNKQEGCEYIDNQYKSRVILAIDKSLRDRDLRDGILIAVSDETSMDLTIDTYKELSPEAKKAVGRINTHSYSGTRREEIRSLAKNENTRGYCLNNLAYGKSYRKELLRQVKEWDLDGLMIDEVYFYEPKFCACPDCRRKFTRETGLVLPMDETSPELFNNNSILWRAFQQWRIKCVGDWFVELRKEISAVKPNFSLMVYTLSTPS